VVGGGDSGSFSVLDGTVTIDAKRGPEPASVSVFWRVVCSRLSPGCSARRFRNGNPAINRVAALFASQWKHESPFSVLGLLFWQPAPGAKL